MNLQPSMPTLESIGGYYEFDESGDVTFWLPKDLAGDSQLETENGFATDGVIYSNEFLAHQAAFSVIQKG